MPSQNEKDAVRRQSHFLHEVEHSIREANRAIIQEQIPGLDKDRFVEFSRVVARVRASYLREALKASEGLDESESSIRLLISLRSHREAYEEAVAAFGALERAIERGYVDIADDNDAAGSSGK